MNTSIPEMSAGDTDPIRTSHRILEHHIGPRSTPAGGKAPMPNHGSSITNDPRWQQILTRDRSADGLFWYSVITTGIYCKPSCASKRPRPENIAIHSTVEEAQATGARACLRCAPDDAGLAHKHEKAVTQACRQIEASTKTPSLEQLAHSTGMTPTHFQRVFKQITGLSPRGYAIALKRQRMRDALVDGNNVTNAIYTAGFGSSSRFYENAPEILGMNPKAFAHGAAGEVLTYAVAPCDFGFVLVASSTTGIVAILPGNDANALVRDLLERFKDATFCEGDEGYVKTVTAVVNLVNTPTSGMNLPLDIRGTAFQQRVWSALLQIPPGTTASYSDIAEAIGQKNSTSAVARACAANALAVAIPCHRVVRRDGSLSGYRWGTKTKKALLEREKAQ